MRDDEDDAEVTYGRWDVDTMRWVPLTHGEVLFALLEPDPPPAVPCPCGVAARADGPGYRYLPTARQLSCRRCVGGLLPA